MYRKGQAKPKKNNIWLYLGVILAIVLTVKICNKDDPALKEPIPPAKIQRIISQPEVNIEPETRTCAGQGNRVCDIDEYCQYNGVESATTSSYCCTTNCVTRIQDDLTLPDGSSVTVEKRDASFIVWYGTEPPIVGNPNFVVAYGVNPQYTFNIPDGTFDFILLQDTENSITVALG